MSRKSKGGEEAEKKLPKPLTKADIEMARRLYAARMRAGFNERIDASKATGIAYQTLIAHESETPESHRNPKPDALFKYANAYNVSVEWLLGGKVVGYTEPEAPKVNPRPKQLPTPVSTAASGVPVLDVVAAGKWSEPDLLAQEPSAFIDLGGAAAYKIEGTSMNRVAADGDVVLCRPWGDMHRDPRNNDLLIIERRRGDLIERTLKRHINGMLHCESTDPRWKDVSFPLKNGDEVKVLALAVALHREL